MRYHQRLGDLIGSGLLLDDGVRLTVNRVGGEIQLVRIGADARAQIEFVPPDDRDSVQGWARTAERTWNLRGLEWRFESLQETRARWE